MRGAPLIRQIDAAVPAQDFRRALTGLHRVGAAASYWRTFWFPLEAAPSNVIEALVPSLRPHLPPGAKPVGVEWWIGRMQTHRVPLDFHHDRDLKLFEATGRLRHPIWSSVLFFTRVRGGSLLVTDQRLRRKSGALVLDPEEPGQFETARPQPNRFVVFPGDRFHGVLDARNQTPSRPLPSSEGQLRLSVVVNWWDRRPMGVPTWSQSRAYRALAIPSGRSAARSRTSAR